VARHQRAAGGASWVLTVSSFNGLGVNGWALLSLILGALSVWRCLCNWIGAERYSVSAGQSRWRGRCFLPELGDWPSRLSSSPGLHQHPTRSSARRSMCKSGGSLHHRERNACLHHPTRSGVPEVVLKPTSA